MLKPILLKGKLILTTSSTITSIAIFIIHVHWTNISFILLIIATKDQYNITNDEEIMGISFCKSNKKMLPCETRRQYSYSDENRISMKYTKNKHHQDCPKKKPFGDKGEGSAFAQKQKDSFSRVYSHSLHSLNGYKTLTFRIKTIFRFYIEDDYLHLMMPMSFFIGLQEAFMARDFVNVSILA